MANSKKQFFQDAAGSIRDVAPLLLTAFLYIVGKVKTAIMLLDINSKVNATDLLRDTPLHLTLRADHAYDIAVQLTTILLQYGASPTLLGREDDMPIDIARYSNQSYCLELLEMALGKMYMMRRGGSRNF